MFCTDIPNPIFLIFSSSVPQLLYYSHIPSAIIALLLGFFVYFKNKQLLESKILFSISIVFFIWILLDLVLWTNNNSGIIMFFWSLINLFELFTSTLVLYFSYTFLEKKDAPFKIKLLIGVLLLIYAVFMPTRLNLSEFTLSDCGVRQAVLFYYFYFLEILFFLWLSIYLIKKMITANAEERKITIYFSTGVICFLASFSGANVIASLTEKWQILQYGLFGMPIFMGFLVYLIVKFKAFNIKLIGVQALVIALVILIGSQFAFIRNDTNKILTGITLALAIGFGWFLIRSVQKEVKQREELELANLEIEKRNEAILERNDKLKAANKEISERKNQLQKISDSLAIANDKLKKLDTAKTEFVSMASHQLRTPPTPIKGYSSMLLEGSYGPLNDEQKRAVENISAANNQQIAFVEDLLSVSRIESGSMKFEYKNQQIGKLCQEVVNNLVLKARDKNLYLDYTAPAIPLPEINIDGAKIREVISNLVDNSLKYTIRGGVTIITELCNKNGKDCLSRPHLRITVSDTGIGVPADEIPYLFQKFSRGKDITRLNTGGTGLGLYVVKMIAEANGGKVWIESPGKDRGSKFILELPLEQLPETLERNG